MNPLDRFALRTSAEPTFFGHALARFAADNKLTDAALCAWLGCSPTTLTSLRICGMPRGEADVRAIAERFGVEARRLAEAVGHLG